MMYNIPGNVFRKEIFVIMEINIAKLKFPYILIQ